MVVAQPVSAPLTRAAIFLVVTINRGPENRAAVRSFLSDVAGLIRAVEFRDLEAGLSCVIGIGSDAWDRLFGNPRPAEHHPFQQGRTASRGFDTGGLRCTLVANGTKATSEEAVSLLPVLANLYPAPLVALLR